MGGSVSRNPGTVLQSDIEKIKLTLAGIDQKAFELRLIRFKCKRIYVVESAAAHRWPPFYAFI